MSCAALSLEEEARELFNQGWRTHTTREGDSSDTYLLQLIDPTTQAATCEIVIYNKFDHPAGDIGTGLALKNDEDVKLMPFEINREDGRQLLSTLAKMSK